MRLNEIIDDTDPALYQGLLKLHKGAIAGFNAKTVSQLLGLFPGWTMIPEVFIKPSDELGYNSGFREETAIKTERYSEHFKQMMPQTYSLHTTGDHRATLRLDIKSYFEEEATALRANVAKYEVSELPAPKKAKPDDYFVMNLTTPKPETDEDGETRWAWSFNLYRKCRGYHITAPDGQFFDVCGPTKILGYGGTKDFAAFFTWALANTDLEAAVNEKLGMSKHVKAADRPRVPVGGQTIGTCAICAREQVVRNNQMVLHGYQRPGYGYVIGNCFGVGYRPYELGADACVAYIPVLEGHKQHYVKQLADLNGGRVTQFTETKHDWRTNKDIKVIIKKGDREFEQKLKSAIADTELQIEHVISDIAVMRKRIDNWKPGTLRRIEADPAIS